MMEATARVRTKCGARAHESGRKKAVGVEIEGGTPNDDGGDDGKVWVKPGQLTCFKEAM